MKEPNTSPEIETSTITVTKTPVPRKPFRGGAKMIVQQFKERQRLPFVAQSETAEELPSNVPSSMELGNFYRL